MANDAPLDANPLDHTLGCHYCDKLEAENARLRVERDTTRTAAHDSIEQLRTELQAVVEQLRTKLQADVTTVLALWTSGSDKPR